MIVMLIAASDGSGIFGQCMYDSGFFEFMGTYQKLGFHGKLNKTLIEFLWYLCSNSIIQIFFLIGKALLDSG